MLSNIQAKFGGWRYQQAGKRDLRIDYIRGFAIFVMGVYHLGIQSYYRIFTANGLLLTGANDAFFFIAGYMIGLTSRKREFGQAARGLLLRNLGLYLTTITLAFGFMAVALLTSLGIGGQIKLKTFGDITRIALQVITLQRHYFFSDILVAYVVYIFAGIGAIWLMKKGHTWLVVLLSITVYALNRVAPHLVALPFSAYRNLAANNPVLIGGVILGYHKDWLTQKWYQWKHAVRVDWVMLVLGFVVILGSFIAWTFFPRAYISLDPRGAYGYVARATIMPVVVLIYAFFFFRWYFLVLTYLWDPLNRLFGWFTLVVGARALTAFTYHLILIVLVRWIAGEQANTSNWIGTFWVTVFIMLLWLASKLNLRRQDQKASGKKGKGLKFAFLVPVGGAVLAIGAFILAAVIEVVPLEVWEQKLPFLFN